MRWLRSFGFLVVLGLGLTPGRVEGQFGLPGIPQIVYDPSAAHAAGLRYAQLIKQGLQQAEEIRKAQAAVDQLQTAARRFQNLPLVNFATERRGYERLFSGEGGLGYNNPLLDRVFREAFPESKVSLPIRGASGAQQELIRKAAHALVLSAGQHGAQLKTAERALDDVRRLASSASTQSQIAQSQAALEALSVEEAQQARQLNIAAVNQQAAMDAYQVARDVRADSISAAAAEDHRRRDEAVTRDVEEWRKRQKLPDEIWRPGVRAEDLGLAGPSVEVRRRP